MAYASFTVGSARYADDLRRRLQREVTALRQSGYDVALDESSSGDYCFFHVRAAEDGVGRVRRSVAGLLTDLIARCWQVPLLDRAVRLNYRYLDNEDRQLIIRQACRWLEGSDEGGTPVVAAVRRGRILRALHEYLEQHGGVVVEGFVTFRLKEYLEELEEAVDRAVDDLMLDREHAEFIGLLRQFVQTQLPRLDVVHAVLCPEGDFRLMDSRENVITNEYLEHCITGGSSSVNQEDLLISALITIAPQRLVVHCRPGCREESVETLRQVFSGRTRLCHGCVLCGRNGDLGGARDRCP